MPFDSPVPPMNEGDRRLTILADYLDTSVKDPSFHIIAWRRNRIYIHESECGTIACAVGHACDIPEFQALGLHYDEEPIYNGRNNWDAVADFFSLTREESEILFHYGAYGRHSNVSRQEVIGRLRGFVATRVAKYETV